MHVAHFRKPGRADRRSGSNLTGAETDNRRESLAVAEFGDLCQLAEHS